MAEEIISSLQGLAALFGIAAAVYWWKASRTTFRGVRTDPTRGFAAPLTDEDVDRFNSMIGGHNARAALFGSLMAVCLAIAFAIDAFDV